MEPADAAAATGTAPAVPQTAIAGRHVAKSYGQVRALTDASVEVAAGRIVALFGDNGAGKSTLLKCLLGVQPLDAGEIVIADRVVHPHDVRDVQALGVDCIYQDLALAPDLSVVDTMFLGHPVMYPGWRGALGALNRAEMSERADAALRELSITLPSLQAPVGSLSGGQRQAVAVARAVMWSHTAILMDEPTAALGAKQSEIVAELMHTVAGRGLGVLVVSHDLPRMLATADEVCLLLRGRTLEQVPADTLTVPEVVAKIVGYTGDLGGAA